MLPAGQMLGWLSPQLGEGLSHLPRERASLITATAPTPILVRLKAAENENDCGTAEARLDKTAHDLLPDSDLLGAMGMLESKRALLQSTIRALSRSVGARMLAYLTGMVMCRFGHAASGQVLDAMDDPGTADVALIMSVARRKPRRLFVVMGGLLGTKTQTGGPLTAFAAASCTLSDDGWCRIA